MTEMITYCGLYCGACPSYQKGTCLGCRSEDRKQNRKSKWGCKIRICCNEEKNLNHCGLCEESPCDLLNKRLINSHKKDPKYNYRHQIPENFRRLLEIDMVKWSKEQEKLWSCPECGSPLVFYNYKCIKCEKIYDPQTN